MSSHSNDNLIYSSFWLVTVITFMLFKWLTNEPNYLGLAFLSCVVGYFVASLLERILP